MLKTGALAPHFKLPSLSGETYDIWDFRQRKNLVVVLLSRPEQKPMLYLMAALDKNYKAYREQNAELLVVVYDPAFVPKGIDYPFPILLDTPRQTATRYLGSKAVAAGKVGVFVLDQYGEIWQQWLCGRAEELPVQKEIIDTLYLIERQCPE